MVMNSRVETWRRPGQASRRTDLERTRSPHTLGGLRSVALISSYVPRRCGIATFTADLAAGLASAAPEVRLGVVALNDTRGGYAYPDHVLFEVAQNELGDYRVAADYLNSNRIDIVSVQHEYGLFGGADGGHILKLMGQLRMPVVTTLHTVLRQPTPTQKSVLSELAALSDRVVTMTETGRRFLAEVYGVEERRVAIIPHGIPDLPFVDPNFYKDQFGVEGRKVLLTLGLLSPNKGIENVIRALPQVAAHHPDVVYMVVGATHPHVRRREGESYRLSLLGLARDLGVDDRVIFHDRYVDSTEFCEFLGCADVVVTPYLNEEQVVSGTLSYAMGAGKAVVSTPYWHARDVLAEGRGVLVPFRDPEAMARALVELLADEAGRQAMRKRAYLYSRDAVWSAVGRRYAELFTEVLRERRRRPRLFAAASRRRVADVPALDLRHLRRLTDGTGILQHSKYWVPDRQHGYCTDDNARALIVVSRAAAHMTGGEDLQELAVRYLAFLRHAFNPERGMFRNLMGYERRWLEEQGSPDSHGRALWALGVAAAELPDDTLRLLSQQLLHQALPAAENLPDLRATAFALLGLAAYLERYGGDSAAKRTRGLLAERLWCAFRSATEPAWPWPEETLTYANAVLPQALLESGRQLGCREMVDCALACLHWLMEVQTLDGHFSAIGNQGWYRRGGVRARFDQQPIEAQASLDACISAFRATGERLWLDRALAAFHWFLGGNDLGQGLYDHRTGGCYDGLQPTGVNLNQGAESTLAWLHALIQVHVLQAEGHAGWTRPVGGDGAVARPDLIAATLQGNGRLS
jgi:glycosyltransferase involved in cell wall biosynthesis